MKPYLSKLNSEQFEAATSVDGFNFILAGAGSGKTATLTARTTYMVDIGIPPEEILLLTFTNKAAKEMRDRIISSVGTVAEKITACTFHSFCAIFIRKNAKLLGFNPDYTILDSPDMIDALSIAKEEFLEENEKQGKSYNLKDFPNVHQVGQIYECSVNNCVSVDQAIDLFPDIDVYRNEINDILSRFKQYKKDRNLMDYNDLLYYTEKVLSENEFLRSRMDETYKYISCDEYQDTNTVQNNILKLLSKDYPNLTVVGDDNQSIYAFRYANIQNILNFEKLFPDCKSVVLHTNYRSSQELLDFSNAMMEYATEGKKKVLKGTFHGEKPKLIVKDDCYDEADYIIKKIINSPYDLSDIAIICRSANQSYILEQRLNMKGIPYNKFGGLKFLEKVIIKDILAFLRIFVNLKDEIALFRVLQLYPGIGKTYARRITDLLSNGNFEDVESKYGKRAFYQYIEELKTVIKDYSDKNLSEQMKFLTESYYEKIITRKIEQSSMTSAKKSEEFINLKQDLIDAETLSAMANSYRSTSKFLNDIVLDATTPDDTDDKLNITTIHSAKGLEYDMVFILDCVEGITPRCQEDSPENPEELRCMYVASTRAKKELYIMIPRYYNFRNMQTSISHFINKIDILNTMQRNITNDELLSLCEPVVYSF
jgi:DNA helicase-2/ATP-dependent DNA helicase PcrA